MNTVVRILGGLPPETFGEQLAAVCRILRLSAQRIRTEAWELAGPVDRCAVLRELLPLTRSEGAVIAISQAAGAPRAMLFDLDSTLTGCEFLDLLAQAAGLGNQTQASTRAAMEGQMDFATSYRERVALLAGTPVAQAEVLIRRLPLADGAIELFGALRARAIPTAIVTGGYARVGRAVQERLGADALYATELEEQEGRLTGRFAGALVDAAAKVAALDDFCARCGLQRNDCAAVGDGANDLPLLAAAGCGILYTAAPENAARRVAISRLLDF